jgi:hypothetical protein
VLRQPRTVLVRPSLPYAVGEPVVGLRGVARTSRQQKHYLRLMS